MSKLQITVLTNSVCINALLSRADMCWCVHICMKLYISAWGETGSDNKRAGNTRSMKKKGFSIYSKITRNWPEMSCLLPKGNTSLVASKKGRFNHRLQDLNICKFQTTTRRMKAVCEYILNWFYYYVLAISRSFTLPLTFGRCSYDSGSTRGKE